MMHTLKLVIANKTYSSWSLRPWLLLKHFALEFSEIRVTLDTKEFHERIADLSPSRRVPALHDGNLVVWDSLAICEYLNEVYLNGRGWPAKPEQRAIARAVCAEMHAGFQSLREQLPMNLRREPRALASLHEQTLQDIARIRTLWRELLGTHAPQREVPDTLSTGPFLFGEFSIADCFYAPVASRFRHYAIPLGHAEQAYVDTLYALPAMQQWLAAARAESETLTKYDSR